MADVFALIAAGIVALWGVNNIVPTKQVVAGSGNTTQDNRICDPAGGFVEGCPLHEGMLSGPSRAGNDS